MTFRFFKMCIRDRDKGTAWVKTQRTGTERLVKQARKGNMGCTVVSWIFLLAVVALIVFEMCIRDSKGMTQSEVAQTVSKGRSTIANALRLLDLPEEAQQLLFEEKITAGHARAILSVDDAEGRKKLTEKLKNEKLSVRETEALARMMNGCLLYTSRCV